MGLAKSLSINFTLSSKSKTAHTDFEEYIRLQSDLYPTCAAIGYFNLRFGMITCTRAKYCHFEPFYRKYYTFFLCVCYNNVILTIFLINCLDYKE